MLALLLKTSTIAPICGTPLTLRTYPEITPGVPAAIAGSVRPSITINIPSLGRIPIFQYRSPAYSTLNVAVGSTVCLERLSFTLI